MSDEEKKAIELLKKLQKKTPYIIWGDGTPYNKNNQIQTILNLIDKQQKEIEELKAINQIQKYRIEVIDERELISKDKIRERKKWYEDTCKHLSKNGIDLDKYDQYQGAIEFCEELLEEK